MATSRATSKQVIDGADHLAPRYDPHGACLAPTLYLVEPNPGFDIADLPVALLRFIQALAEADEAEDYARILAQVGRAQAPA